MEITCKVLVLFLINLGRFYVHNIILNKGYLQTFVARGVKAWCVENHTDDKLEIRHRQNTVLQPSTRIYVLRLKHHQVDIPLLLTLREI